MPFHEDFDKVFWSVLAGFMISLPLIILTIPKEKIIHVIIYTISVFIFFEIYFFIRWLLFYRKEKIKFNTRQLQSNYNKNFKNIS